MRLSGIETISIELAGVLDADATTSLAARVLAPLTIDRDAGGAGRVSVLVLEMHRLGYGWPLPRFDYREVLYRLGVAFDGVPAWLALRCDIDRALVRRLAAATIRYPVRSATIAIDQPERGTFAFRAATDDDSFSAKLQVVAAPTMPEVSAPRRTFVVDRGRLFEVPWDETPAPVRDHAEVADVESGSCRSVFGAAVTLEATAVVHQGRTHFCGAARALR